MSRPHSRKMFSYSPLHQDHSEVRLVRFSQNDSPSSSLIQLEIRHTSLEDADATHYAALSYTCGDVDELAPVLVTINGEYFVIGDSLHAELLQLRENGVRSWLWVDAICIAQSDAEERTWHTKNMRAIYGCADLLYLWLGPGCDETDRAMDFMCRFGPGTLAIGAMDMNMEKCTSVKDYFVTLLDLGSEYEIVSDDAAQVEHQLAKFMVNLVNEPGLGVVSSPETGEKGLIDGIEKITMHKYWHQIWVIQEVAVAKDTMVLCGSKSIPVDAFQAVITALKWVRLLSHSTQNNRFLDGLSASFHTIPTLEIRRKYRHAQEPITMLGILFHDDPPPLRPLYSASDPRDIVFAALGILPENEFLDLDVDYEKSPAQIFTDLTRALIAFSEGHVSSQNPTQRFRLSRPIPRADENSCDLALPSWVPDWREVGRHGFGGIAAVSGMATAGTWPPIPETRCSEEDDRLQRIRRPGCIADVVTEVLPMMQWEPGSAYNYEAHLASILDFANLGTSSSPEEDYVWRTIVMDRFAEYFDVPQDSDISSEEIAGLARVIVRREPIDAELLTPKQRQHIDYVADKWGFEADTSEQRLQLVVKNWEGGILSWFSRGRALFKTVKGMFGLGHVVVQPGDLVALLWGLGSPVVLRPRNESCGGGFTYVGDAYVDGIMYGEFLQTLPMHEVFDIY
ncbi:Heterokaryon incompatibility protein 6, OR allele [Ilyonectria robusta]